MLFAIEIVFNVFRYDVYRCINWEIMLLEPQWTVSSLIFWWDKDKIWILKELFGRCCYVTWSWDNLMMLMVICCLICWDKFRETLHYFYVVSNWQVIALGNHRLCCVAIKGAHIFGSKLDILVKDWDIDWYFVHYVFDKDLRNRLIFCIFQLNIASNRDIDICLKKCILT